MKRRRFLGLGARSFALGAAASAGLARGLFAQSPAAGGDASTDETTGLESDGPLARVPGLNAVEIRLGMSADFTGTGAAVSIDALRGALAWLNEINSLGGIEGRRLELLAEDDGGDPRRAVLNVRSLLEEYEVFCLFNLCGTATLGRVLPLLYGHREQDLWLLGEISGAQAQRTPPFAAQVLPVRASHRVEMAALVDALRGEGASRFGLFYPITPHGRSGADAAQWAVRAAGARIVAEATWRFGAGLDGHVQSAAEHLRTSGADALLVAGDGGVGVRLLETCRDAGWRVPAGLGASLDCDGWYGRMSVFDDQPAVFTSRPMPFMQGAGSLAQNELERLLERWRPQPPGQLTASRPLPSTPGTPRPGGAGAGERPSAAALEGFLHARLLTAGLRLAGPWPTRRSVRDAIDSLRAYDLGLGAPLDMGEDGARGLRRAYVGRWLGGRWRVLAPTVAETAGAASPDEGNSGEESLDEGSSGDETPDARAADDETLNGEAAAAETQPAAAAGL